MYPELTGQHGMAIGIGIIVMTCLYFIIRSWSKPASEGFWRQMVPYLVLLGLAGFAWSLFWMFAVGFVVVFGCFDIYTRYRIPEISRPFFLPPPICPVSCRLSVAGGRTRRVKGELLPPVAQW